MIFPVMSSSNFRTNSIKKFLILEQNPVVFDNRIYEKEKLQYIDAVTITL